MTGKRGLVFEYEITKDFATEFIEGTEKSADQPYFTQRGVEWGVGSEE